MQSDPKTFIASRKFADSVLMNDIDRLAFRFPGPVRREVRRLMRLSPRLADLAIVFPGALYVIAQKRGTLFSRQHALRLIEDGRPLKVVARALDLPLWLRRLPPEAFANAPQHFPSSELFARRIANRMPRTLSESALWLGSVCFAARACSEEFALWLAEQPLYAERGNPEKLFGVLAAYAWFSDARLSRTHGLIVVPWRPEIAFDTALCAAKSWLNRLRLVVQLGDGAIPDTWLTAGAAMEYTFTPLTEQQAILEEAHMMQNCADQYAERLSRDRCRLFSVRKNGLRVATLEIGPHTRETGVLTITQLKARHNMPAPLEVWQAAHAWLATQPGLKRLPQMTLADKPLDTDTWGQLMLPYRLRKSGAPWIADPVSSNALSELDSQLADLARRGGVSSWLFT